MARRGELTFRELRVGLRGGSEARLALPQDRLPGHSLAALLRAVLDGLPATEGIEQLLLDVEADGERFRVIRGGHARLVRLTHDGEEVLAEGDARVTELLARIAGATEPLGRRVVARAGAVATWLRDDADSRGTLHAALAAELDVAAQALGGRMRDLLHRAEGLLHDASDELAPERGAPLAPEELASLREDVAGTLGGLSSRLGRIEESVAVADALVVKLQQRQERIREYARAEALGRKLDKQRHLIEGDRRRLDRARAAASLERPGAGSDPAAAERAMRRRREAELEAMRAELSPARAALAAEEARAPERDAVAAWITRLSSLSEALDAWWALRDEIVAADARIAELEAVERECGADVARDQSALERAQRSLAAIEASPEEAAQAHEEAVRSARLAGDVRRLAQVRDELRDKAREVQLAKIAAERADEELELAQREVEWSRSSPHPRDASELPVLPALVTHRDRLVHQVEVATAELVATREDLRQRTSDLGTRAYLSPELLEAEAREKAENAARFGSAGLDRAEVEGSLVTLQQRLAALHRMASEAASEIGELSLRRVRAREALAEREEAIPQHLRTARAIETALTDARTEHARRLEAWDAARRQATAAEERVRDAEETLRRARAAEASAGSRMSAPETGLAPLRQAGFESWDEVEDARLDDSALSALEADVAEHETLHRMVEEGQRQGRDDMLMPRADAAQAELMQQLLIHARDLGRDRHEKSAHDLATIDRWLDALDEIAASLESAEAAAGFGTSEREHGMGIEDRVREGLMRQVLARAEARLAGWGKAWSLSWGETRRLVVREASSEVPPADALSDDVLALALAVELARAGEPLDLACLWVEGIASLPEGASDVVLVLE